MSQGKVIITCGPSHEPIDEVRRLTNFSTGELGVLLSNALTRRGYDVTCFKGTQATTCLPLQGATEKSFTTNQDLLDQLTVFSANNQVTAAFHAAALGDFTVDQVLDGDTPLEKHAKISSSTKQLTVRFKPAIKVLASLRGLFPKARIVGWKYELNGTREDALQKGWNQIERNTTDACVVNGKAYGEGFALCTPPDQIQESASKVQLCKQLADWLTQSMAGRSSR